MEVIAAQLQHNPTQLIVASSYQVKLYKFHKEKIFALLAQNSSVERLDIEVRL